MRASASSPFACSGDVSDYECGVAAPSPAPNCGGEWSVSELAARLAEREPCCPRDDGSDAGVSSDFAYPASDAMPPPSPLCSDVAVLSRRNSAPPSNAHSPAVPVDKNGSGGDNESLLSSSSSYAAVSVVSFSPSGEVIERAEYGRVRPFGSGSQDDLAMLERRHRQQERTAMVLLATRSNREFSAPKQQGRDAAGGDGVAAASSSVASQRTMSSISAYGDPELMLGLASGARHASRQRSSSSGGGDGDGDDAADKAIGYIDVQDRDDDDDNEENRCHVCDGRRVRMCFDCNGAGSHAQVRLQNCTLGGEQCAACRGTGMIDCPACMQELYRAMRAGAAGSGTAIGEARASRASIGAMVKTTSAATAMMMTKAAMLPPRSSAVTRADAADRSIIVPV